MRQRLLEEFDTLWFDCMNGDSRETGKLTPDGEPDPSVFSTETNTVGIRVGTAVCLMVRKEQRNKRATVRFQNYWGKTKRQDLLASGKLKRIERKYETAKPAPVNKYSFRPTVLSKAYLSWPSVLALCAQPPFNGPIERRGNSLIVFPGEEKKLELLRPYLEPSLDNAEICLRAPLFMKSSGEFNAAATRKALKGAVSYDAAKIRHYPFKPFDVRIAYLDPAIAPLFSRPAPQLLRQSEIPGNAYFITRDTADKSPEGPPFLYSSLICDYDCLSGHARHFPVCVWNGHVTPRDIRNGQCVFEEAAEYSVASANLSSMSRNYLAWLQCENPDKNPETAPLIWLHALAIGYSPAYLEENADGIRQDWPRIPLPATRDAFLRSVELGRQVANLLDTEKPVPGVTAGKIAPELKSLGIISTSNGGMLHPENGELDVTAGWGHAGKGNVCMPGKGAIAERSLDAAWREKHGWPIVFGDATLDVFLNETAFWANVPRPVWEYTIGGYQAIKKWLSYREKAVFGRGLNLSEAEYATGLVRRIAALVLIQPTLDANYNAVKTEVWP